MNSIRVFYTPQTEGSRCLMFLAVAWVELMKAGLWTRREILVTGTEQAVYAVSGKEVVGVLSFHIDEGLSTVSVGYVSPAYRARGVYTALKTAYEKKSREQGAKQLVSICHPDNTPIQELCRKTGYVCYSQQWRKTL
jgi:RimJ/RimL family protein N-acetyltransferase